MRSETPPPISKRVIRHDAQTFGFYWFAGSYVLCCEVTVGILGVSHKSPSEYLVTLFSFVVLHSDFRTPVANLLFQKFAALQGLEQISAMVYSALPRNFVHTSHFRCDFAPQTPSYNLLSASTPTDPKKGHISSQLRNQTYCV